MLREVLSKFGVDVDTSKLESAQKTSDIFAATLKGLPSVVGAAAGALGLNFIADQMKDLAHESGELGKASIKSGVGVEDFQRIAYETGLSTEQLTAGFRGLQRTVASASDTTGKAADDFADLDAGLGKALGAKKAQETLKALGVELDANGARKGNKQLFLDVAGAIGKVKDPSEKTAIAMRVFGKSGQDLLPFLSKSPEQVAALADEFDSIGGFTNENVESFKNYSKQIKLYDLAVKKVKISLASELAPAFTFVYGKVNEGIAWFKKHVDTSQLVNTALLLLTVSAVTFGQASLVAGAKAAFAWARVALPVIVAYLLIDDFIHFLNGDANTALEDFFVAMLGPEDAKGVIFEIRDAWRGFKDDVASVPGLFDKVVLALAHINEKGEQLGAILAAAIMGKNPLDALRELETAKRGAGFSTIDSRKEQRANEAQAAEDIRAVNDQMIAALNSFPVVGSTRALSPDEFAPRAGETRLAPGPTTIQQDIKVTQTINTVDAEDAANKSVAGVKGAVNDSNRASMAALDARAGAK